MVDVDQIRQLFVGNAFFFGILFLAAGFLSGFVRRAVTLIVLAAGVLVTIAIASTRWESQDLLLSAILLGGGLVVSALLALALRWGMIAAEFAMFLVAWYLLLHGWMGAGFVSIRFGSALWIVATVASTSVSARLGRLLPGRLRPAIPTIPKVR